MRCLLLVWAALGLRLSSRGLEDVTSLLQQMMARFQAQGTEDQKAWDEYEAWSDQQRADKQAYVQEQESVVSSNTATYHASDAQVQSLTEALALLTQEVTETKASLAALASMRQREAAEHTASLTDLTNTIDSVNRAIEILGGHYTAASAVQVQKAIAQAMQLQAVQASLMHIDQTPLTRLIQDPDYLSSEYNDKDFSGSTTQDGGHSVVQTLTALRESLRDTKQASIDKENEGRRQYEEANSAKETDLHRASSEIAVKNDQKAESSANGAMASAALTQANLDINEAQQYLSILDQDTTHFREVYQDRVRMRNEEMAATQAAIEALRSVSVSGSMLQRTSGTKKKLLLQVNPSKSIATVLLALANKDHSAALVEAAVAVRNLVSAKSSSGTLNPEAMNPVKDMLRQLIHRLEDEANAETSHKEWCDNEKKSAQTSKDDRASSITSLTAETARLNTDISTLTGEIDFAIATVARVADETTAAAAVRSQANDEYQKAHGDHVEIIRALDAAVTALSRQSFSLVQVKETQKHAQSPGFSAHSESGSAGSALSMLQDLRSRYATAKTALETEETQQVAAYEQLQASNEAFRKSTVQTKESKEGQKRSKILREGEAQSELVDSKTEHEQVSQYLVDLKPSCDDIRSTFEERKKRREDEIEALKSALDALSDMAAR